MRPALAIVPISIFQSDLAAGTLARIDFALNSPNAPLGMIVGHEVMGAAASALVGYLRAQTLPGETLPDQAGSE